MKELKLPLILLFLNIFILEGNSHAQTDAIRVMTFNVRVNVQSDSMNAWPNRKEMAASMIRFHHADLIGLQEALLEQVEDLSERLPDYKWFGIGRDDGDKAGEFMAIFYLSNRFEVLASSTFWLSENPEIPGRGWDAACNRTVTWGQLKDKKTGRLFFHFNTHFDHLGEVARKESAKTLLEQIRIIAGNSAVIVTGDFNSTPDSVPYQILTQGLEGDTALKVMDTREISITPHHGPNGTFTGFKLENLTDNNQPIDYIFITDGIKVAKHGTLSDSFNGMLPSDHMPVLVELIIK